MCDSQTLLLNLYFLILVEFSPSEMSRTESHTENWQNIMLMNRLQVS